MGIRLSEDEVWDELNASHTGILTTLKRDGWPVTLPVWFAVRGRTIYVRTPAKTKKVARVRNDGRGCFLVESGLAWRELRAVSLPVSIGVVEDREEIAAAHAAIDAKYSGFRVTRAAMPGRAAEHYGSGMAILRLDAAGPALSWDNARLKAAA
jgi:general stress protein 26